MAAQQDEPRPLVLELYEDDEPMNQFCKGVMQSLANGSGTPSQAATDFDAWVVNESSRRLRKHLEQPEHIQKSEDGSVLRTCTPNASGYVDHFFQAFPSLCSVFSPYHAGQTRVIQFLEALMAMPEHQAPDSFSEDGEVRLMSLWSNTGYATEYLRIGADAISHSGSGLETPGSEQEVRWRNYQSTIARITLTGFSNCGFISGLRDILPHGKKYPSLNISSSSGPQRIGGFIQGAAQWVMWPDEGRYVYQQCKKKEKVDKKNPREIWSTENWEIWKTQFQLFADEGRIDSTAREVASLAVDKMKEIEEQTHS
ncbi:hypothetical protein F4821DRAFT_236135 [Hypoxylon rubiginosum]|uniref:Uncharacterized protein n=1 Tax=Hypoxylon rubiginosum TaxID=110542 RepID=A0ACC0D4H0_9PEZI|nr:hypothetical protein F4821DRAFT_236135 [Hypoxylon rubiginosum]